MAMPLGAGLRDTERIKGTFGAHPDSGDGRYEALLAFYRGAAIVNRVGRRFVDEAISYKLIGAACLRQPGAIGFQIFDGRVMERGEPGVPLFDFAAALAAGRLVRADTPPGLAHACGIDQRGLEQTLAAYNAGIASGAGPPSRTGLCNGTGTPPPLDRPPFYAFPSRTALLATYCGLATGPDGAVLDTSGRPIAGLYAAGEVTGCFHGEAYMTGSALGKAAFFGRAAGRRRGATRPPTGARTGEQQRREDGAMIGKRTALALACAIAWCGAGAAQTGAPPAQAAGEPLRLGLLLDMSGPYADLNGPGSETAAKMAAEDFGGRVLGRPIEVVAADHSNRADIASARAREWFGPGRVSAIMDVAGSSAALAVQEVGRNANRVVVLSSPASTRIVNESCSPTSVLYTYTTYAIAQTVGRAAVAQGGRSWYFIAADYAFGHGLVQDTSAVVRAAGGTVLGSARHPLGTSEFSNFLLQAQSSRADVVALANAGSDMINAVKQAREFGLDRGRQRLAALVALVAMITDIHSMGLSAAQGLLLSESFYWDLNEETRAWSRRFFTRFGRMPTMLQAGTYSSVVHYLKAVQAAGTDKAGAVMRAMRSAPVNDFFARNGRIREDGLMVHDMHLFQVKTPAESTEPWDYYRHVATIPGDEVFPSECVRE